MQFHPCLQFFQTAHNVKPRSYCSQRGVVLPRCSRGNIFRLYFLCLLLIACFLTFQEGLKMNLLQWVNI